ncbi:MAG: iron ABC transporter permease [Fretibacterium sp.]|nr:iron ABC transporter permease [Fretibacterium sp.]
MKRGVLPVLLVLSVLALVVIPFVGMQTLSWRDVLQSGSPESKIFWELRLPRVCLAWVTGATLSVCGTIFQALFRTPLASPDMLGVSSGAAFGAVLSIRLGFTFTLFSGLSGLSAFSFLGAGLTTALIYAVASWRREGVSSLLLTGIAFSFLFSSLTLLLQYSGNYVDSFRMARWTMGSIQTVGFSPVWTTLPALFLIFIVAFLRAPELDLFLCGEELAESRGVSIKRLRRVFFISVSLAVALNVSVCGPIGFIGLMAPHICRRLVGPVHRPLVVASALFGGTFLTLCDTAARTFWAPAELPVGALTALMGSIFFLWLLLRREPQRF